MPGFLATIDFYNELINKPFCEKKDGDLLYDNISCNNFYAERWTIKKFENDKFFKENDDYVILVEGVIFNLNELKKEGKEEDFFSLCIKLYEDVGEIFFKNFKGCFSGFLFNKNEKECIVFTDQLGTKPVYFSSTNNKVFFGSEVKLILEDFRQYKLQYSFCESNAYLLLTYGFLFEDKTLLNEIKKLEHGKYLKISFENVEIKTYFELYESQPLECSFEEAIERLDVLFKKSIKSILNKNKEYGYKTIAPLSAGLDSRTVNYVIKELEDIDITNITYSQSEFYDNTIPIKIAGELKNRIFYMNLDNGISYITNFAKAVKKCEGQYTINIGAMLFDFLDNFNMKDVGVVITGVSGDCVIGTSVKCLNENTFNLGNRTALYADSFVSEMLKETKLNKKYINEEDFRVNNTDLGNMSAYFQTFQEYSEAYSPFLDIDLMKFCYSLPLEYRINNKLYYKWIEKKHFSILKHPKNGRKINTKSIPTIKILGRHVRIDQMHLSAISYFKRRFLRHKNGNYSMNPVDTWYHNNLDLKNFMDNYFNEKIDLLKPYSNLYVKAKKVYQATGDIFGDKVFILSLLGTINEFFDGNNMRRR